MNNRYHAFSRKSRQLKYVLKQINQLTTAGKTVSIKLIHKLRRVAKAMEPRIGGKQVAQLLGGAALLLATTSAVQAQTLPVLATGLQNPIGIQATPDDDYNLPTFADLDGDGDLDFLTTQYEYLGEYNYISNWVYQENTGTADAPVFGPVQNNPFGLTGDTYVEFFNFADLDSDGDQDLLVNTSRYDDNDNEILELVYIQNTGTATDPVFATPVVNPFNFQSDAFDPDNFLTPIAGDINGDGDVDLIIQNFDGRDPDVFGFFNYFYFENESSGGTVSFADAVDNPFGGNLNMEVNASFTAYTALVDIDQDGDLDLVGGGIELISEEPLLAFAQNNGTSTAPAFGAREINPFEVNFGEANTDDLQLRPAFTDIDGDGDVDMFAFDYDNNLIYFENVGPSSIRQQNAAFDLTVSPNPTDDVLNISTEENVSRIEISNVLGRQVISATSDLQRINLSELPNGIYLVKVITEDNRFTVRKIRKQN